MSQSGCSTFTPTWSFIQSTTRVRTPPEHTREHWNISQINTLICKQWITSMSKVPQWTITCICIVNKNYWTNFNLFTADLCKRLFSWHLFFYTCAYQLRYWPCNLKITSNVCFYINELTSQLFGSTCPCQLNYWALTLTSTTVAPKSIPTFVHVHVPM